MQAPPAGMEGPAEVRPRAKVTFDLPFSASLVTPDTEEEDDDRDSFVSAPPIADRMLIRLVNFIYD